MLLPKLDERLQTAYNMFPPCKWGADVGCDHGRLPLHLLACGKAERMIVSDISAPALAKGRALVERYGFGDRAVFCEADGLTCLDRPV
ncbi:MAG: tRNA (adenine(22)-N(1))-methyltransferase TrmK, partial [Clostridia bacterium]|nr:tRNA (adenine(22)-N(1))-methyltransferase TrmK [Clostridia bacterium]